MVIHLRLDCRSHIAGRCGCNLTVRLFFVHFVYFVVLNRSIPCLRRNSHIARRSSARVHAGIEDVAREAGVSICTASRAFRGMDNVSSETRRKVLAAAEKVGYRPNRLARALRTGNVHTVALIMAARQSAGTFYLDVIAELKRVLAQRKLQLIISVLEDDEGPEEITEDLLSWCGMVAVQAGVAARHWRSLVQTGASIVLVDGVASEEQLQAGMNSVAFDECDGVGQVVRHLVALGHRNIAYLGGLSDQQKYRFREQGFRKTMQEVSLPVRPEWLLQCAPDQAVESTRLAFDQAIMASRGRLSAFVCETDSLALSLFEILRLRARRVPSDYSVVGYGNTAPSRSSTPPLTSIEHRGQELGHALGRLIVRQWESRPSSPETIRLPARLIVRDSTAPRMASMNRGAIARPAGAPSAESGSVTHGQPRTSTDGHGQAQDGAPLFADGIYEFQALHSGLMLDDPEYAWGWTVQLRQIAPYGLPNQLWLITHVQDNWYTIRSTRSWLFVDAASFDTALCPAAIITPRNVDNPDSQLWSFEPVDPQAGSYKITNRARGYVLDVIGGSTNVSGGICVYPWANGRNQQWVVRPVPFLTGEYEIVALHSCMALQVPREHAGEPLSDADYPAMVAVPDTGPDTTLPAGTAVPPACQADRSRCLEQRWRLFHRGQGRYTIRNMHSNLFLVAVDGPAVTLARADGQKIAFPEHSHEPVPDNWIWRIELVDPAEPTYRIVSSTLGFVLQIESGFSAPGATISAGEWSGATHQQWLIYEDEDA